MAGMRSHCMAFGAVCLVTLDANKTFNMTLKRQMLGYLVFRQTRLRIMDAKDVEAWRNNIMGQACFPT